eukprot:gene16819-8282_t
MAPVNYGIWGKPTATLDWCEENYIVTQFVAEFWNTISNWIMIIPPLLAAHLSWRKKMEFRIIASYLSVGFVGIGSLGFHCTLIYKMQLMDELPMIYGTCILLYGMLEIKSKENKMNTELTFFLFVISVFTTIMYVIVQNPLFFQWSYGILAGSLFGLTFYNCKRYNGSVPLVLLSTLRTARALLPEFVKPVTQLHAWWHTLAGGGTYISVLYSSHLRLKCLGHQPLLKIYYHFLPIIEKNDVVRNGTAIHKNDDNNNNNTNDKINTSKTIYANGKHLNGVTFTRMK